MRRAWVFGNVGDVLVPMNEMMLRSIIPKIDEAIADEETGRLRIALILHERRHGRLPETLEEIDCESCGLDPIDPFSGDPYRYDPDRRVLWSVGVDGVDDGGELDADPLSATEPDLVWPIPPLAD